MIWYYAISYLFLVAIAMLFFAGCVRRARQLEERLSIAQKYVDLGLERNTAFRLANLPIKLDTTHDENPKEGADGDRQ